MQATPDAGRYVCKKYGANFDLARMRNDPAYNAALGAAEAHPVLPRPATMCNDSFGSV
jgi:hypothetical protein